MYCLLTKALSAVFTHIISLSFMNCPGVDSEVIQMTECFVTLVANVLFYSFMNSFDMLPQTKKCGE